jgi:UDP-N-acetylmuramoyl-L-alanyl-D-glutamate--2,6-diaminopimelate ligase
MYSRDRQRLSALIRRYRRGLMRRIYYGDPGGDRVRTARGRAAAWFWGNPSSKLPVVGITGTDGKTTTTFLLRGILEQAGIQTGLIGTLGRIVGGVPWKPLYTTPPAPDLQRTLSRMIDSGDRACVMEVSSHALTWRRTDGLNFRIAVFHNLSQEHLDFHGTMEDYFQAKRRLFVPEAGSPPRTSLINVGDEHGRRLADEVDCLTYAVGDASADFRATDVSLDRWGSRFKCHTPAGSFELRMSLPGRCSIENGLAAIAAAYELGVHPTIAARALESFPGIPGRFERIDLGQEFGVVVDYAHTPRGLEELLRATRLLPEERLICVFSCRGDRDRGKRPVMGRLATEIADLAVLTSQSPGFEDPAAIIDEVLDGTNPGNLQVVAERRSAIAFAFEAAQSGDVVVVAGRGHEGLLHEAGRRIPFDDREVARSELRRLGYGSHA